MVTLYKLYFLSFHFSSQPNKRVFHPSTFSTLPTKHIQEKTKGMFDNCFFSLFSVFKNNFLFLKLKNLFGNSKWIENKNCSQNSICEGN